MPNAALQALISSEQPLSECIVQLESPIGQRFLWEQNLKDGMYAAVERVREEFAGRTKFRDDVLHTRISTIRSQYEHLSTRIARLEEKMFAVKPR
jgi:hypothetical protein